MTSIPCHWISPLTLVALLTYSATSAAAQQPTPARQPADSQPIAQQTSDNQSATGAQSVATGAAAKLLQAYDKTKTAKSMEDWTEVIDLCDEGLAASASAESSNYAKQLGSWAHNKRGEVMAQAGREDDAVKDFVGAIQLDPSNWRAIHNRGVSHAVANRYDEALADFNRVIELHRNYSNTWFNRGEIKYARGQFASAIQDYTQAIRINPQDAPSFNSRGHAFYRMGRYREAMDDYDTAVQINPQDASAFNNRGDAFADLGYFGEAVRDYREAIKLDPKLGRTYQSIAWLMATCPDERYRDPSAALDAAKKAIEIDGDKDFRYLDTLAAALANAGQFDEAVQAETKALSMAPPEDVQQYQRRLDRYKDKMPYRNGPRAATMPTGQLR